MPPIKRTKFKLSTDELMQGVGRMQDVFAFQPCLDGRFLREPVYATYVKVGHANVHMGPTTVNEVIVLAPKDTVLPVLGRRGEWVHVGISPALRKTGMVMRWYKNEDNGWIHDSLLEIVQPAKP